MQFDWLSNSLFDIIITLGDELYVYNMQKLLNSDWLKNECSFYVTPVQSSLTPLQRCVTPVQITNGF